MKKMILTGLTAAMMSASAMAAEVTGYTAPQSGAPATAAGVDANFQALITAINDNNTRIAALESEVAAAQSSDVSGKSYLYREFGMYMAAHTYDSVGDDGLPQASGAVEIGGSYGGGFSRTNMLSAEITLEFLANGNVNIIGTETEVEMWANPNSNIGSVSGTLNETASWTQSGNVVTVDFGGGDTFDVQVSRSAEVITIMDPIYLFDTISQGNDGFAEVYSHEFEMLYGVGTLLNSVQ